MEATRRAISASSGLGAAVGAEFKETPVLKFFQFQSAVTGGHPVQPILRWCTANIGQLLLRRHDWDFFTVRLVTLCTSQPDGYS